MSFDCFLFDFGGTLAHSEPAYREAFRHTVRLHTGLEIDETEFRDFWNLTPAQPPPCGAARIEIDCWPNRPTLPSKPLTAC